MSWTHSEASEDESVPYNENTLADHVPMDAGLDLIGDTYDT